jgi:GTP pyrophosphokinase
LFDLLYVSQVLHPVKHDELKAKLRESQARGSLAKALDTLKEVLDKKIDKLVDLSGRPKNLYGVFKKMQVKNQKVDDVLDVRALRVIVKSKTDCYEVLRQVCVLCPC